MCTRSLKLPWLLLICMVPSRECIILTRLRNLYYHFIIAHASKVTKVVRLVDHLGFIYINEWDYVCGTVYGVVDSNCLPIRVFRMRCILCRLVNKMAKLESRDMKQVSDVCCGKGGR